jgi:3-hydroxy-9,10-secoandrosta-1,3,5(10)-triene-9,17-dione monooxygenase reductase component
MILQQRGGMLAHQNHWALSGSKKIEGTEMKLDAGEFRQALGSFVTGVTIVTTRDENGVDVGLTANSFSSVSLDPPMVLWSLAKTAASMPTFLAAKNFAINVLAIDQEGLSNRFAKRGEDKFAGLDLERGEGGVPLIPGCVSRFECRGVHQYEGGDHIIFVGEVIDFANFQKRPLAFHAGRYAAAASRSWLSLNKKVSENEVAFGEDFLAYLVGRTHHQFYARIRPYLSKYNLSEVDHYVLGLLQIGDGRSQSQLDEVIAYTGQRATDEVVNSLKRRDLICMMEGRSGLWLTPSGGEIIKELTAITKATELEAEGSLDGEDIESLKNMLNCLINGTDSGV